MRSRAWDKLIPGTGAVGRDRCVLQLRVLGTVLHSVCERSDAFDDRDAMLCYGGGGHAGAGLTLWNSTWPFWDPRDPLRAQLSLSGPARKAQLGRSWRTSSRTPGQERPRILRLAVLSRRQQTRIIGWCCSRIATTD